LSASFGRRKLFGRAPAAGIPDDAAAICRISEGEAGVFAAASDYVRVAPEMIAL